MAIEFERRRDEATRMEETNEHNSTRCYYCTVSPSFAVSRYGLTVISKKNYLIMT